MLLFGQTVGASINPRPLAADCVVQNANDSGPGSLRACMAQLSANNTITFNPAFFQANSPTAIVLSSPLPVITVNNVTIDASDAGVILDGLAVTNADGLVIDGASGVTIKGLHLEKFGKSAIRLQNGATGNTIGGANGVSPAGCSGACNVIRGNFDGGLVITGSNTNDNTVINNYIGTNRSGTAVAANNSFGVQIANGAQSNIITGNLISGNLGPGVIVTGSGTTNNTIANNRLGSNQAGTGPITNLQGVLISSGAQFNTVSSNLISGNALEGISLTGADTQNNTIVANQIGTDVNGVLPLQNRTGIALSNGAQTNMIMDNLVSGNNKTGITLAGSATMDNTITGNDIGPNRAGTAALLGSAEGIALSDGAHDNTITDNVISGNTQGGVIIAGSMANTLTNNLIGTNRAGTVAIPNSIGIELRSGAHSNDITANLVSGNNLPGLFIAGNGTVNNRVAMNKIGTNGSGSSALSNKSFGLVVANGAQANLIDNNLIGFNNRSGVVIFGMETVRNTLSQNRILANADKGIALLNGGNGGLRAPGLTNIGFDTVQGVAPPGSTVEIFSDAELQGQNFEGTVVAGVNGNFSFTKPGGFAGTNITAIAIDPQGSTSEFTGYGDGVFQSSGQVLGSGLQILNSNNSRAIAVGDLNRDGQIDAFIVNDTELEIWFNNGAGTFNLAQTLANPNGQDVALGDFNRNGFLDAVVGNSANAQLWLNNGSGGFTAGATLGSSDSQAVAAGDLNNDTFPDIVVGSSAGQSNQTWINDGSGSFNPGDTLGDSDAQAIGLGDLDDDDNLDIVLGNNGSDDNQTWINDGSGSFNPGDTLSDSDAQAIGLGDLNNDGALDIVIGSDGLAELWVNDGSGSFNSGGTLDDADTEAVALGDLNNDGFVDIFLGNGGNEDDQVWINNGSGVFDSGQVLPGGDSQGVGLGDLDNDNDLDVFIVNGSGQVNQVLLNQNKILFRTGPAGGTLTVVTTQGYMTQIEVPAGVLNQNTTLIYRPLAAPPHPFTKTLRFAQRAFSLEAEQAGGPVANPFSGAINIRLDHSPAELTPDQLLLYYWDEAQPDWLDAATTCTPASAYSRGQYFVKVGICHLTDFSLFGPALPAVYLPTILKN